MTGVLCNGLICQQVSSKKELNILPCVLAKDTFLVINIRPPAYGWIFYLCSILLIFPVFEIKGRSTISQRYFSLHEYNTGFVICFLYWNQGEITIRSAKSVFPSMDIRRHMPQALWLHNSDLSNLHCFLKILHMIFDVNWKPPRSFQDWLATSYFQDFLKLREPHMVTLQCWQCYGILRKWEGKSWCDWGLWHGQTLADQFSPVFSDLFVACSAV